MIHKQTISPLAHVHPNTHIADSVHIEPFTSIGKDVEIGEGSWIGANVTITEGVKIGRNCRILSGSTISGDVRQLEFWNNVPLPPLNGSVHKVIIGDNVHIESGVTLHGEITVDSHTWISSNVVIHDGARIGKHCKIFPGAVISAIPQDLKFRGERTLLEVGDHTTIRECATLNRGTAAAGMTKIGSHVLIMAYVHIAHDCIIGNNVILANAVNMGGHVEIDDYAIIGGMTAIHQFVKIGKHTMVSGGSLVRKDIPPFIKAGREPLQYEGVNTIGLRRRKFSNEIIRGVQEIYRHIFLSGMNYSRSLEHVMLHCPPSAEREEITDFFKNSERGVIKGHA